MKDIRDRTLLRLQALQRKLKMSRSTIYLSLRTDPRFPRPRQLSTRAVAWFEDEVDDWLDSLPIATSWKDDEAGEDG